MVALALPPVRPIGADAVLYAAVAVAIGSLLVMTVQRFPRLGAGCLSAIAMVVIMATPVFAQEVAGGGILSSPAIGFALELAIVVFGPILAGLGGLVLARLYKVAGLKQTAENRATVEQVLERAVDFARARYGGGIVGAIPHTMKRSAYRAAAEYAIERGPDALASFGIKRADSLKLEQMLESRFVGMIEDRSGSANAAVSSSVRTPAPTR